MSKQSDIRIVAEGEIVESSGVVLVDVPPEASWHCDSFYVSRERLDGMRDNDVLRVLRRLVRLRELDAPEIIIDNDTKLAMKIWTDNDVRALASWPDDARSIAVELGLT